MPKYLYKCNRCEDIVDVPLPISFDPKQFINFPGHKNVCLGLFWRIMRAPGAVKGFKTFAGDWFKKTYGQDIGAAYEDKARQKTDYETMKRELDKDK